MTGNIIILGKKDIIAGPSNWITRDGSVLGNPFPVYKYPGKDVIQMYRVWLSKEVAKKTHVYERIMELVDQYLEGKVIYLRCVCKPKACHGDVIKEMIIYMADLRLNPVFEIEEL